MTWLPLAEHDPVPGDPYLVGDLGMYFTDEAAKLRAIVAQLDGLDAGMWEGQAAEAFAERRTDLVPHLKALATRWEKAAAALKVWSLTQGDARTQANAALERARHAAERRTKIEVSLVAAGEEAAAAIPASFVATATGRPAPDWDPTLVPWLQGQLSECDGEIDVARMLLRQAKELYEEGAVACETALNDASDDTIENKGGVLAGARRVLHSTVKRFPQIKAIAKGLGLAAAVLGLAAAICTGVGALPTLAFIAGGLSATANTALWASGDGPWTAVAWDAFGLLTFGVGRAYASAARGTVAARTLEETHRLQRLTSLKGVVAEGVRSAEPLTGIAAKQRLLAQYRNWSGFGSELAEGVLPEARNVLKAAAFWKQIEIPPADVLAISRSAARYATTSRVAEGLGLAGDFRGLVESEVEMLDDQAG